MEIILLMGNFLNGGTNRGGAAAFKLNTLTKLTDTKATDNKSSLVNYLVKVVLGLNPSPVNFSKDISHLEAASKVSLPTVTSELATLKKDFATIQKSAESVSKFNKEDRFQAVMGDFIKQTQNELDELSQTLAQIENDYKALCEFYGEDPKTDPGEFLSTFVKFQKSFEDAVKQNDAEKAAAEKTAKREAAKKLKEEEDEKKKKLAAERKGGKDEAVVDDLLSTITSGSAFQTRRPRPGAKA